VGAAAVVFDPPGVDFSLRIVEAREDQKGFAPFWWHGGVLRTDRDFGALPLQGLVAFTAEAALGKIGPMADGPREEASTGTAAVDPPALPVGGSREGLLLLTLGRQSGRVIPIVSSNPVTIGRGEECTVALPDAGLSRVHAEFLRAGEDYLLRDLGSKNGSFVNGARADGIHHLANGDRIQLGGETIVRFSLLDAAEVESLVARQGPDRIATIPEGARPAAPAGRAWALLRGRERVVRDPAMVALYEQVALAARASISVLILGETGVGKEVVARAVHDASPRADRQFLALNCAALSESLLEAELFGHEQGAYTGATRTRPGLLETAEGGTVFLDEIGELAPSIQVKLLRVIEERKVRRIGGRGDRSVDVRFLSATNRNLDAEVPRGAFREDLLFRLNGFTLTIPPLRQRAGEIDALARLFLERACKEIGCDPPAISQEFLDCLLHYGWPGNVRELKSTVERAIILCQHGELRTEHLPDRIRHPSLDRTSASPTGTATAVKNAEPATEVANLRTDVGEFEKRRILEALERFEGNQTLAAKALNISRRSLVSRLSAWGLTRRRI